MQIQDASDKLNDLREQDRDVRIRVLGYSRWFEPAKKTEIFEKMASLGYDQKLIENNVQRLQSAGLMKVTDNYYLPLDKDVCDQAARVLLPEILQELATT